MATPIFIFFKIHVDPVFQNKNGGEITFKITNEHLWVRVYHEVAFLAESGRGVSYIRGGEE